MKISEMTDGVAVASGDLAPVVRSGANVKIPLGTMAGESTADYTPTAGLGDLALLDEVALTNMADQAANTILANATSGAAAPTAVAIAANKFMARSSTGDLAAKDVSDAGLALIDDADGAAMRTTLGLGNAPILQVVTNYSTSTDSTSTAIPIDDTIPQNTEGKEFITATITPLSASNSVLVTVRMNIGATAYGSIAVFRDSVANALDATTIRMSTTSEVETVHLSFLDSPATTSAVTYRVRFGPNTGTAYVNQNAIPGRYFGGVSKSGIILQEIRG